MGHVYRRHSGRGWRLRQRSMALWPQWIKALQTFEPDLRLQSPLIQLADDDDVLKRMQGLVERRQGLGLQLLPAMDDPVPCLGGLSSQRDGRLEPLMLQRALRLAMATVSVQQHPAKVRNLKRTGTNGDPRWRVETGEESCQDYEAVVICTALNSDGLLAPLGHERPMTPVLGQVIDLELKDGPSDWKNWPAVLSFQGFNLVPKQPGRLLLGATLEPGAEADPSALKLMLDRLGSTLPWLKSASPVEHWWGLRARPVDRPAPLLEQLEPGLLLASGHYRNGVLLAPATAEWVEKGLNRSSAMFTTS